ncbi:MAG: phosphodiesterase [Pseudomonadota bacterium]
MLKLIQITDCHLMPEGERLFESDPAARLGEAIDSVIAEHADAALVVLTGDLAHDGLPEAYRILRRELARLPMPWQLVPGNHDDRAALRDVFPEVEADAEGFLQTVRDLAGLRLLFLDTVDPGVHSGAYCAARRAWLAEALRGADGRPACLFMHHPPMPIGIPRLDQYGLAEPEAFAGVLEGQPIRQIFFGHVHRPLSGSWRGIPFSALPGTNHQNQLVLSAGRENLSSLEPPAYAVILIDAASTLVHLHAFADRSLRFVYDPDAPPGQQVRRIPPGP